MAAAPGLQRWLGPLRRSFAASACAVPSCRVVGATTCVGFHIRRLVTAARADAWRVVRLAVADAPEAWQAAGFAVNGRVVALNNTEIELTGQVDAPDDQRGIVGWTLSGDRGSFAEAAPCTVDGLPTTFIDDVGTSDGAAAPRHANYVTGVDHVVVRTPAPGASFAEFERVLGAPVRGRRQSPKFEMAFYRFAGPLFAEIVGPPPQEASQDGGDARASAMAEQLAEDAQGGSGASRFVGLALVTEDIDALAQALGTKVGRVKDAVQPGRRIVTLRHQELGISVPIAFMSPHRKQSS